MTQPCLSPRGVFVPTQIIFHPELPSTVLVTWIKLRSLAWKGWVTPPMNLSQLASHLGIHPARLKRHLAMLQELATLSVRDVEQDKISISFPENPSQIPEKPSVDHNSKPMAPVHMKDQDSAELAVYFPTKILGYLSYEEDEEGSIFPAEISLEPAKKLLKPTLCPEEAPIFIQR
jgi:hypothetical protein